MITTYTDLSALLKSINTPFGRFQTGQDGPGPSGLVSWLQFEANPAALVTAAT